MSNQQDDRARRVAEILANLDRLHEAANLPGDGPEQRHAKQVAEESALLEWMCSWPLIRAELDRMTAELATKQASLGSLECLHEQALSVAALKLSELTIDRDRLAAQLASATAERDAETRKLRLLREKLGDCESALGKAKADRDRLAAKVARCERGLQAVEDLIGDSQGVVALHRNGEVAPWDELRTGGRYEEWLLAFDEALADPQPEKEAKE